MNTTMRRVLPVDRAAPLLLVAAVLLAYLRAFAAAYQFDDYAAIVSNPAVSGLAAWWAALPGIRPLLKLSYALSFDLGGGVVAIHAGNIAIHAINTVLLWRLWRAWLPQLAPDLQRVDTAALLAALLFALHPAATEAVTYASGRSIALAASVMLAALLVDTHARLQPSRRVLAWGGPILFALALGVRETAAVLPAVPLLLAWVTQRSLREELWRLRGYGVVLALAAVAASVTPGYRVFFGVSVSTRAVLEQAGAQLLAHAYLATRPLLGFTNIDPDLSVPSMWSWSITAGAALLFAAVAIVIVARRRRPWLAFAIGWYLLQLAPSNSLLPRLDLANDRHLYLALAGPALAVSIALAQARAQTLARAVACALCATLAVLTWQRNADYRSETALWQATVQASPHKARAWLNLGYAWKLQGDDARAAAAYRCALALDPRNAQAAINLSLVEAPATDSRATGSLCAVDGTP